KDKDQVEIGNNIILKAIDVPSHSRGHILLFSEELETTFTGDAIQGIGTKLKSGTIVFPLYDSVEDYLTTLEKLERIDMKYTCTGHLGVLDETEKQMEISRSRQFIENLNDAILSVLKSIRNPLSLHDLAL